MSKLDIFSQRKEAFIRRLLEECEKGLVDFDIKDFLIEFNKLARDYFTTSSCSGRIILAETKRLALAKSSHEFRFIKKWHRPVTMDEILHVLREANYRNVWLLVRAPIIHFTARSIEHAYSILKIAQQAGFKHSGIISLREDGETVVEVQADDRLDVPLVIDGERLFSEHKLRALVDIANETLMIGKLRLVNLIGMIEKEILGKNVEFRPIELSKIVPYREFDIDRIEVELLDVT